jgi:2-hydroxychromene-2-carboxylate isomerase
MTGPTLDFWYEFASTYSYPAAMRIERLAEGTGVTIRWRPFLLGPIFGAQGWNDSPFNIYPVKGRYMWRDLERICVKENLPLKLPPARFPQNGLKAARIALVGEREKWVAAFTRAVYTANFGEQKDISDETTLSEILVRLGLDATQTLSQANAPENKELLKKQTEDAQARGVFGAPSFTVGDELFWGNDRLEDAINFAVDPVKILADELAKTNPSIVEQMKPWLRSSPKAVARRWDYHAAHEVPVHFLCWLVLEHPGSGTGIAYCPRGFGPEFPWGLIGLGDRAVNSSMGPDSAWFPTLAQAFQDLFVAPQA